MSVSTPADDRALLLADLDERFAALSADRGVRRARRWYAWQAVRSVRLLPGRGLGALRGGEGFTGDLRTAARALRRRPAYALGVIGTMATALAAFAIVGSVAWSVWLAPFPFPDPDRVVRLYEVDRSEGGTSRSRISPPLLEDLRARSWTTVLAVAGVSQNVFDWRIEDDVRRVRSVTASPEIFDILDLTVIEGRPISTDQDAVEVVLTEPFWVRAFGADPGVVGAETMALNGTSYTVVGVVRAASGYPRDADVFTAIRWDEDDLGEGMRGARFLDVIARVGPEYAVADAATEMDRVVNDLGQLYGNHRGWGGTASVLSEELLAPYQAVLRYLLTAGVVFLLLAMANVGGLASARALRARRDRAVRLALGSSEGRLFRASAVEGALLALCSGLLSLLLAAALIGSVRALVPAGTPRAQDIAILPGLAIGVMVLAVLSGGMVSALGHLLSRRSTSPLPTRAPSAPTGGPGRSLIVAVQVALTTVLGTAGVVVLAEMSALRSVDLGFEPEGVASVQLMLSGERMPTPEARRAFWEELLGRAAQRGVSIAIGTSAPMSGMNMPWGFRPDVTADQSFAQYHIVSPGYFQAFDIDVVEGRGFTAADRADSEPVVVVSRAFADEIFPGMSPIGREIQVVADMKTIVGVVEPVHHFGPDREAPIELYAPHTQDPWPHAQVLVRGDPAVVGPVVTEIATSIDPGLDVPPMGEYARYVEAWFAALRLQSIVVGLLAILGTLLAGLGLYALVAYRVDAQRRDIGIRMALGASGPRTVWSIVLSGTRLAAIGACIGGVGWLLAMPRLAALLGSFDGVGARPPLMVVGAVIAVSVVACAIPASRSARVDPADTLRAEGG
ncbi:MAG: ABC transporter permease [Gemmatimonadota bacterium]